ncbi:MAG: fimbrial protein [Enterobacteriaceae bacterium]|nr:fimbrial protein [Enterobacteriaceae bacterium]
MKRIFPGLMLLFFNSLCWAAGDGICHNADGDTNVLNLSFGVVNVSAANNQAGYTVKDALTNTLYTYPVRCHCDNQHGDNQPAGKSFYPIYYTGDPAPGLIEDRKVDGLQYYALNDYLSVGVKVFIINNSYAAIPFEHLSNQSTSPEHSCDAGEWGHQIELDSGRSAKLSFYLRHSITGTVTVPRTEVAWLYAGINDYFARTKPVSKVTIAGTLIAPQNCEMTPGQRIDVDLGKINAGDFPSTPGGMVTGKKVRTDVKVSCTGMQDVRTTELVHASMVATGRSADATMITTTNADVGIKIYDKNGRPVSVDGGALAADMDPIDRLGTTDGNVTFYSVPASMTGNRPTPGETFTADATLIIEFTN